MHWLGYNDAVSWLNEAKTRIFQPTGNFENLPVFHLPASQRQSACRCRAPEILHDKGNGSRFSLFFVDFRCLSLFFKRYLLSHSCFTLLTSTCKQA